MKIIQRVIAICLICVTLLPINIAYALDDDISEHNHSYYVTEEIPATCDTPGSITFECDCCDTYTDVIPAGHSYEYDYIGHGKHSVTCNKCSETNIENCEYPHCDKCETDLITLTFCDQYDQVITTSIVAKGESVEFPDITGYISDDDTYEWYYECDDLEHFASLTDTFNEDTTFYLWITSDIATFSADTIWQNDYQYALMNYSSNAWHLQIYNGTEYDKTVNITPSNNQLDTNYKYIYLLDYFGDHNDIVVPGKATISGVDYITVIGNINGNVTGERTYKGAPYNSERLYEGAVADSLTFESGVIIANTLYETFLCAQIKRVDMSNADLSRLIGMTYLFGNHIADTGKNNYLEYLSFGSPNLSRLKCVYGMLKGCTALREVDGMFSAPYLTNTSYAFQNCYALKELDVSGWTINNSQNPYDTFEMTGIQLLKAPTYLTEYTDEFAQNGLIFEIDNEETKHITYVADICDCDIPSATNSRSVSLPQNNSGRTYICPTELKVKEYQTDKIIAYQYGYKDYKSDWYIIENYDLETYKKYSQEEAIEYLASNNGYIFYDTDFSLFDFQADLPARMFVVYSGQSTSHEAIIYAIPKQIRITPQYAVTDKIVTIPDVFSYENIKQILQNASTEEWGTCYLVSNQIDEQGRSEMQYMFSDNDNLIITNSLWSDNHTIIETEDEYRDWAVNVPEFEYFLWSEKHNIFGLNDGSFVFATEYDDPISITDYQQMQDNNIPLPESILNKDAWHITVTDQIGIEDISSIEQEPILLSLLDYTLSSSGVQVKYETLTPPAGHQWMIDNSTMLTSDYQFTTHTTIYPYTLTASNGSENQYETSEIETITEIFNEEGTFCGTIDVPWNYLREVTSFRVPILPIDTTIQIEVDSSYQYNHYFTVTNTGAEYIINQNGYATRSIGDTWTFTEDEVLSGQYIDLDTNGATNYMITIFPETNALDIMQSMEFRDDLGNALENTVMIGKRLPDVPTYYVTFDDTPEFMAYIQELLGNGIVDRNKIIPTIAINTCYSGGWSLSVEDGSGYMGAKYYAATFDELYDYLTSTMFSVVNPSYTGSEGSLSPFEQNYVPIAAQIFDSTHFFWKTRNRLELVVNTNQPDNPDEKDNDTSDTPTKDKDKIPGNIPETEAEKEKHESQTIQEPTDIFAQPIEEDIPVPDIKHPIPVPDPEPEITTERSSNMLPVAIISIIVTLSGGSIGLYFLFARRGKKICGTIQLVDTKYMTITLDGKDHLSTMPDDDGYYEFKRIKDDTVVMTVRDINDLEIFSCIIDTTAKNEDEIYTVTMSVDQDVFFNHDRNKFIIDIE